MQNNSPQIVRGISEALEAMNLKEYQKHINFHILKFDDHLDKIAKVRHSMSEDYFELTFSTNHSVDIDLNGTKFTTENGQIVFMAPGQVIDVNVKEFPSKNLGYMILFTVDFLDFAPTVYNVIQRFPYYNMNQSPFYRIDSKHYHTFLNYFEMMYDDFQELDEDNIEIIKAVLTMMLFKAKKLFKTNNLKSTLTTRPEIITYQFENLLKNTLHKKQKISYYSNQLNISAIYLSECVKKVTNKPAKRIITDYLIFEAKSLIMDTSNTLENIAIKLGFDDTPNFINFFKKNTKLTPSRFRRQVLGVKL